MGGDLPTLSGLKALQTYMKENGYSLPICKVGGPHEVLSEVSLENMIADNGQNHRTADIGIYSTDGKFYFQFIDSASIGPYTSMVSDCQLKGPTDQPEFRTFVNEHMNTIRATLKGKRTTHPGEPTTILGYLKRLILPGI